MYPRAECGRFRLKSATQVGDLAAGAVETEEQDLVQQLVAHLLVEALSEAVLHRLTAHDELPFDRGVLLPVQPGVAGQLRAVVTDQEARFAASRDDRRQLVRNASARDRGVRNRAKALLRDVVHDVEDAEATAVGELVRGNLPTVSIGASLHVDRRAGSNGLRPRPPFADRQCGESGNGPSCDPLR